MGNGHEVKNQLVIKCVMIKLKCGGILDRSTETNVSSAPLAMMRSMEFLNISERVNSGSGLVV